MLHGEMSHAATWWRMGPALAERGWSVLALDLPGHGVRPRVNHPLHLPELVQGVASRLPGTIDLLVGHGLGAVVAAALASRYLDLTDAVVLEEPLSGRFEDRDRLAQQIAADSALVHSGRERLAERLRAANPRWLPDDVDHAVAGVAAADVPALLAGLRAARAWDLPTMVRTLRAAVLVLTAPEQADPHHGSATTLRGVDRLMLERKLPADRFAVLDGGHYLHRDVPEAWLKSVTEFADVVYPPT